MREDRHCVHARVWNASPIGESMARRDPSYAASSNLLDAALATLREPTLSARDRAYFVAVTNEILAVEVDGHGAFKRGDQDE